jgi:FlaA1/EpsC-like NDP-sugar epimerase
MNYINKYLLQIPRLVKRILVMTVDVCICITSVWLAFYLRLGEVVPISGIGLPALGFAICLCIPIFIIGGLYRMVFRYTGWFAIKTIIKAHLIYAIIYGTVITIISFEGIPRTIGIIQPLLLLVGVSVSRGLAHYWLDSPYKKVVELGATPNVLIYGSGATGRQLARAIEIGRQMKVVGFLDDDISLQNSILDGRMIYRPIDLVYLVNSLNVKVVLLAIPSASRARRNEILLNIASCRVSVRNLPSLNELAGGIATVSDLQELEVEDLLGRDPVPADPILLDKNIRGVVVLVTGAGGSIGSELCRQIIQINPKSLVLVEQSEHALYQVHQELINKIKIMLKEYELIKIIPLLGSVQDDKRMEEIFGRYQPDIVFHAAAYKHVPLVESNPFEAVKNNIFGTQVLAKVAALYSVKNFVFISTDKAVRPTNIMGATKRVAELIIQAMAASNNGGKTCFSIVRFGNVLNSSGSVVPKFSAQIKAGGPVTITDIAVTRYFMTIPEAAQLVIQASSMAIGGEVFVLDMGEPVKIIDLAKRMIQLSGLSIKNEENPFGDIEIKIVGLRSGEKLYEELLIGNNPKATKHVKIMNANEFFLDINLMEIMVEKIKETIKSGEATDLHQLFVEVDIGYKHTKQI